MPNISEINNPLYDALKKEGIYCEEEDYWNINLYLCNNEFRFNNNYIFT